MIERSRFCIDPIDHTTIFSGWHDPSDHWNGFACPAFPRTEIDRIIAWTRSECGPEQWVDGSLEVGTPRFHWDREVLIMTEYQEGREDRYGRPDEDLIYVERIEPIEGPLWSLGAGSWTWSVIDDRYPTDPAELDAYCAKQLAESESRIAVHNAALHQSYLEKPGDVAAARRAAREAVVAVYGDSSW